MSVGASTQPKPEAKLQPVIHEETVANGENAVQLGLELSAISSDFTTGANVTVTIPLRANDGLTYRGMMLFGDGFIITCEQAKDLGLGKVKGIEKHIRAYRNGRDLTDRPRDVMVIDFFGLTTDEARTQFPKLYEHVLRNVKPDRDVNREPKIRENWWLFGRPRPELRPALVGLKSFVAIVETSKHRIFQFLDASILPDNKLVVIALEDPFDLGVLSSRIHTTYALAAGSWLGVGNDPVYAKSRCFDPFPFPDCTEKQKEKIRALADELDAHRKRAQAQHGLGLTDIYNVLAKVRVGTALTAREKLLHDQALVSTLRQLHDDLDAAVAAAYGWPWPLTDAEILEKVVALNAARAAEEAQGIVRWLRPDYQKPLFAGEKQSALGLADAPTTESAKKSAGAKKPSGKPAATKKTLWPKTLSDRVRAVETALAAEEQPATAAELTTRFARADAAVIAEILQTLVTLGRARPGDTKGTFVR